MRKLIVLSVVLVLASATAFAHAGHAHTYMGTVTMLHGGGEFMIRTTDGKDVTITATEKTQFTRADDHPAALSDLAAGMRVVVKMSSDGKTAAGVKMSAATK